jgi:branched-chain amino acid aminotransferase
MTPKQPILTEYTRRDKMHIYYVDGSYLPENRAVLSVNDLGLLRGYGVFDFLRTYNGRPFHLEDHVARLIQSAKIIDLSPPCSEKEMVDITMRTLERNSTLTEANIRLVVTGGDSSDSITPEDRTRLLIMVTSLHHCPEEWYRDGAAIITTQDARYLPRAKSTHYLPAIRALSRARRQGAMESLYVDREKHLLEGTTTNFFAFINGKLITPGDSILLGITRQVILQLAAGEYDIEIRDIHRDEIPDMDEAFITASNKEVVPVVRIDQHVIGGGRPGKRTRRLMQLFAEYTHRYGQENK